MVAAEKQHHHVSFQSSKELYLPRFPWMAHRSPRLSNPQRNFIFERMMKVLEEAMPLSNPQRNFIFVLGGMIAQSTKATFQSSKELYLQDKGADTVVFHQPFPILKGTLSSKEAWTPRERQVPFQSSKELYLPDDVTEMAITEQLFPILKGTLSSRHRSRTAAANKFFPILKGTLSSDMLSIGHGTALDFPILKGTLSSIVDCCHRPPTNGLSNPQRNFIFLADVGGCDVPL